MRELVESEEGHFEVEKVEEVEETLELVEKKQDDGFEAGGRVGGTREYFEGDIGIKHNCNEYVTQPSRNMMLKLNDIELS